MKDFFNKIAKAASVYLDPTGENELKRMELVDKKLDLENIKNNQPFAFRDPPRKEYLDALRHEMSHAMGHFTDPDAGLNSLNDFNIPKPIKKITITRPIMEPAVAPTPDLTPAQRASQVATVMAEGVQGKVSAPQTARFRK